MKKSLRCQICITFSGKYFKCLKRHCVHFCQDTRQPWIQTNQKRLENSFSCQKQQNFNFLFKFRETLQYSSLPTGEDFHRVNCTLGPFAYVDTPAQCTRCGRCIEPGVHDQLSQSQHPHTVHPTRISTATRVKYWQQAHCKNIHRIWRRTDQSCARASRGASDYLPIAQWRYLPGNNLSKITARLAPL